MSSFDISHTAVRCFDKARAEQVVKLYWGAMVAAKDRRAHFRSGPRQCEVTCTVVERGKLVNSTQKLFALSVAFYCTRATHLCDKCSNGKM